MRQIKEKGLFIETLKKEINHRDMIGSFYDTSFWGIVEKFDGKVYNKRFDNALNEALQALSPLMSAKCTLKGRDSYSNYPDNNKVEVILTGRFYTFNYSDKESMVINIVLDCDDNFNMRINLEKSKNEKYTVAWSDSFRQNTEEIRTILKGYDKYLKVAQKVADSINEYKDLPYRFRNNIEFTQLYYLK